MAEPSLDVRGSLRLVRRRWPWVAALCLAGAAGGGAYQALLVPRYHASALVLLPTTVSSGSSTASSNRPTITTDVRIAESAAVLTPAAASLHPAQTLTEVQHHVSAAATASGVLKVTATAGTASAAVALANAVADQLVVFETTSGSTAATTEVQALKAEQKTVSRQLTTVKKELAIAQTQVTKDGADTAAGQAQAQLVATLGAEESSLSLRLESLKTQIDGVKANQGTTNTGTEVIQKATAQDGLKATALIVPVLLGVVAGLIVGYTGVIVLTRRDRRLRSRDAIADAVGSPVILSLEERSPRSPKEWAQLLERYVPAAQAEWHVRRGLRELGIGAGSGPDARALRIVAFSDDVGAAAAAVEIAVVSSGTGAPTVLWMTGEPEDQVALRAVFAKFDGDDRRPRPALAIHHDLSAPNAPTGALVIELATLDRTDPHPGAWWSRQDAVLLAVSAGRSTSEDLARVAISVDRAGMRIGGVVVVNPASEDQTVGRFPERSGRRTVVQYGRQAPTVTSAAIPRGR